MAKIEFGKYAVSFASGCAAMSALLSTLKSGDHVVCVDDVYGGTNRLMNRVFTKFGIEISKVSFNTGDSIRKAIKDNTKMIWFETPTNPTIQVVDIELVVSIAKEKKVMTVCDNTFASSILQNPLLLGVDAVVHSGTKYIGGHCDMLCGVVVTNDKKIKDDVFFNLMSMGGCLQPIDAYFLSRSLKTLKVRMEQHCFNA